MRISIESKEVKVQKGISKKNGAPYSFPQQVGYLHGVGKYPVECLIPIADEARPFEPGLYDVVNPLAVGQYGRLEVNRDFRLSPLNVADAAKAGGK